MAQAVPEKHGNEPSTNLANSEPSDSPGLLEQIKPRANLKGIYLQFFGKIFAYFSRGGVWTSLGKTTL
jgi:hypothetical protein